MRINSFNHQDLAILFNKTFTDKYQTILLFGAKEPFYKTKKPGMQYHEIHCREDFFSSGLHEVAHWCIAGEQRRLMDDFGYWYEDDQRNLTKQLAFEKVEIYPQALEKIFHEACGKKFEISVDNFGLDAFSKGNDYDPMDFPNKVDEKVEALKNRGLPFRASLFKKALFAFYKNQENLAIL